MTEQSEMWISTRAAARIIGCQIGHVRRLATLGMVKAKRNSNGFWRIEVTSLMQRYAKPDGWVTVSEAAAQVPLSHSGIIKAIQAGHLESRRGVRWDGGVHLVKLAHVREYANRANQISVPTKVQKTAEWLKQAGILDMRPVPSHPELVKMAAADGLNISEWALARAMKSMGYSQTANKPAGIVREWLWEHWESVQEMRVFELKEWFERDTQVTVNYQCFYRAFIEVRHG